jgi:hypothetical protein
MANATIEANTGYKLTLKGDGITVERDISKELAKDIITMILGSDVPQVSQKSSTSSTVIEQQSYGQQQNDSSSPRKSLREYLNEIGAKSNPQKILVIANYLVRFMGKETFSIADIKPQFKVASEPIPANLSRDFQIVSQNGWIAPDHEEPKMFFITKTGLDVLNNRFE